MFCWKKTTSFDFIISHCGEGVLLRGGRTEGFKRHPSASTGFRWSSDYMIYFWCRPLEQLSRAASRKP